MTDRRTDGITLLCDALAAVGIDCVFGIPGTQNVELFEGFRRKGIRTVLSSHELAASFMANGYFRASGKVAALATIPGPGFTYALTGLAEARLDSVGLLYLVGTPATTPGRRFQLQAIDQRAMSAPIVKGSFRLEAAGESDRVIRAAHALATSGEPGPVLVEIDLAKLSEIVDSVESATAAVASTPTALDSVPIEEKLSALAAHFERAERPVLLLGQGAFESASRIRRIAESLTIPILTTPSARGIIPEQHPMALGFDSLRGHTSELNQLLDQSDLIVGLGCKLSHNGTSGFELRLPTDRFIHVDASPEVVGANYVPLLGIVGGVEIAVSALELRRRPSLWVGAEIERARGVLRAPPENAAETRIHGKSAMSPAAFFTWLRGMLPDDAIVVTDSGLHQILTRRHFEVRSARGLIAPSDFQSMGYGLPAAIGASLAAPDRIVVAVIGDGGFLMSGLELLTARREGVRLVVFVFNDGQLNQIRLQQLANFGRAHAVRLLNPDFGELASAFGITHVRFGDDAPGELERVLTADGPALIEVIVGDSAAMRALPVVAHAKEIARSALGSGLRNWLKNRLRGRSAR